MEFIRKGKIFDASIGADWMESHSSVPFVEKLADSLVRVYFSSRNSGGKSLLGWFEIDLRYPSKILNISEHPILPLGEPGHFDAHGVMGSELIRIGNTDFLYYIGWNTATDVPFRNSIGLATRETGRDFAKYSPGPILDRSIHDHCFVASSTVVPLRDGKYRMYYLSCSDWFNSPNGMTHSYNIKIAESDNGINWFREGRVAIDFLYENEYAISVPRVLIRDNRWYMFYSYRAGPYSEFYRLGMATSPDGLSWKRCDELMSLAGTVEDWESQMQCYPYLVDHNENTYLFYNGNGYGESGIGYAILSNY